MEEAKEEAVVMAMMQRLVVSNGREEEHQLDAAVGGSTRVLFRPNHQYNNSN